MGRFLIILAIVVFFFSCEDNENQNDIGAFIGGY